MEGCWLQYPMVAQSATTEPPRQEEQEDEVITMDLTTAKEDALLSRLQPYTNNKERYSIPVALRTKNLLHQR